MVIINLNANKMHMHLRINFDHYKRETTGLCTIVK